MEAAPRGGERRKRRPIGPLESIWGFSSVQVTAHHLHSSSEDEEAKAAFPNEVSLQQVALSGTACSLGQLPLFSWLAS